jgi:hypothetical protein
MKRGRDWRGWRARCRGLRGLGDCLRPDDEHTQEKEDIKPRKLGRGPMLVKRGIRKYVRVRITGIQPRRRRRNITTHPNMRLENSDMNYHPSEFRHTSLPPTPHELPTLALEIPDFELWMNELWRDFLIEPTPYLVASAICYLGGVLILVQYYALIWRVLYFFLNFVPLDDEFGLG